MKKENKADKYIFPLIILALMILSSGYAVSNDIMKKENAQYEFRLEQLEKDMRDIDIKYKEIIANKNEIILQYSIMQERLYDEKLKYEYLYESVSSNFNMCEMDNMRMGMVLSERYNWDGSYN